MPECSQGTCCPEDVSTITASHVAELQSTDAGSAPPRWSELYKLIVDFSVPGRALTKGADSTDGAQSLKPGNPIALIAEAEELGGGDAAHAVVARIRPDLLTVDLDGCADVMQSGVLDAAERVGAPLVYLAASGSPNSVHMVFAPATAWARTHLRSQIDEIRTWAGYDTRAVDVLTPARYLRLPGSASLKLGGEFCRPIDADGTPLSAAAAAARARAALVSINPSTRRHLLPAKSVCSQRMWASMRPPLPASCGHHLKTHHRPL